MSDSTSTIAARIMIANAEQALKAHCVSSPDTIMRELLEDAQELVNSEGYLWEVALAKIFKGYHHTRYAAEFVYHDINNGRTE